MLLTGLAVPGSAQQPPFQTFRPLLVGPARYLDANASHALDAGDQLILRFNQDIVTNGARGSSFFLPVGGDTLGTGVVVAHGPRSDEVTITLGTAPSLKARQDFSAALLGPNSASGIDISRSMPANAIEGLTGADAVSNGAVDIATAFVDSGQTLDSGLVKDAQLIDLDCDGRLDLITVDEQALMKVWFNNGSGGFFQTGQTLGESKTNAFAVADVNSDGLVDVIEFGFVFRIWINHGFGNFLPSFKTATGSTNQAYAEDFDRDGHSDVLRVGTGGITPMFNAGTGSFWYTGSSFASGLDCRRVVVADFDGDGNRDVAAAVFNGQSSVWLGDGAGAFSATGVDLGTSSAVGIAGGDLDGDGAWDLVKASQGGSVEAYLGDGDGGFQLATTFVASGDLTSVECADLDADGDLDVLLTDAIAGVRVWLNRGDATFFDSLQEPGPAATRWIRLGDLDSDGDLDFLAGNDNQPKRVWLGSASAAWGTSTFVDSGQILGTMDTQVLRAADLDNDGDVDFIAANDNAPSTVWLNDGQGVFVKSNENLGTGLGTYGLALGDVDGDGDVDAVTGYQSTLEPSVVWHNDGQAKFTAGQRIHGDNVSTLLLFDADGDGDLDLLSTEFGGGARMRSNNGLGVFYYTGVELGSGLCCTQDATAGDLDCDGDLDVVLVDALSSPNTVYWNDGNGSFTDSGQLLGMDSSFEAILEDLNGDGSLDLVVANGGGGSFNRVYFNDGLGNFANSGNVFSVDSSFAVAVGDLDGDGDPDLVFGNRLSLGLPNKVWLNDGFGFFTDSGQLLGTRKTGSIQLADVDGDGDLDLLVANQVAEPNEVWLNE